MLTRVIVYLAYYLKTSGCYRQCKTFCYDLLENPKSRMKAGFDVFMIITVMSSVVLLIYQETHALGPIASLFEQGVVVLFVVEYIMRAWLYSDNHLTVIERYERCEFLNIPFNLFRVLGDIVHEKWQYMSSPFAIIDLLAILPSYRPLRLLRVFLIFRLFKLFRYSRSIKVFVEVLSSKRFELYTLGIFLGFLVFISSTALFHFENPHAGGSVSDLYEAAYLAIVTISTVGYGDITPATPEGRFVTVILILTGLGVLAFFTSIIVAAFNEKMHELRENRVFAEIERLQDFIIICGYGYVGREVADLLDQDRQCVVIIDKNAANIELARNKGFSVIHDDATKNGVLKNAGVEHCNKAILCTTGDDVVNVYITLTSRYLNPDIWVISRANSHGNVRKLFQAGADHVLEPFEILGMVAAEYVGQPVAFEAILGILRGNKNIYLNTLIVTRNSFLDGARVADIDFRQRKLTLFGVISSNPVHSHYKNKYMVQDKHFYFNPVENFILSPNDILVVFGHALSIDYLRDQIEKSRLKKAFE